MSVLQGALDSARSLTGARYGVMTPLDDDGEVLGLLSSGMTSEHAARLPEMRERFQPLWYLRDISEPIRVPDLPEYLRSLGLPEPPMPASAGPAVSFLAAPVTHRGRRAGQHLPGGQG